MSHNERGAGRPSWSLSAQNYTVAYGQAQFMSETGRAEASGWFGPLAPFTPIAPKEVAGRSFIPSLTTNETRAVPASQGAQSPRDGPNNNAQ
jgi:hypothetical protein